jgi:hypothetical protein
MCLILCSWFSWGQAAAVWPLDVAQHITNAAPARQHSFYCSKRIKGKVHVIRTWLTGVQLLLSARLMCVLLVSPRNVRRMPSHCCGSATSSSECTAAAAAVAVASGKLVWVGTEAAAAAGAALAVVLYGVSWSLPGAGMSHVLVPIAAVWGCAAPAWMGPASAGAEAAAALVQLLVLAGTARELAGSTSKRRVTCNTPRRDQNIASPS